jgi:hypothetical protein
MSAGRSFGSLVMVASCAGAALGCYLVSLRVASERAALEDVETQIVLHQRDLRVLQTEIGTRGRLAQLERWNVRVLALSAPAADQFVKSGFELARLAQPERKVDFQAPVVLAAAPDPAAAPHMAPSENNATDDAGQSIGANPGALLHQASLKTETREVPARTIDAMPRQVVPKSTDRPVTAAKPAQSSSADRPGLAAAKSTRSRAVVAAAPQPVSNASKKVVDKPAIAAAKAMTKPVRLANKDPLAPLPAKHFASSRGSAADR